jgi:hypothetical protein
MSTSTVNPARTASNPSLSDVSTDLRPLPTVQDPVSQITGPTPTDLPIEEIRAEAYRLYVDRGGEDGHDLEDWLAAEALVRARMH